MRPCPLTLRSAQAALWPEEQRETRRPVEAGRAHGHDVPHVLCCPSAAPPIVLQARPGIRRRSSAGRHAGSGQAAQHAVHCSMIASAPPSPHPQCPPCISRAQQGGGAQMRGWPPCDAPALSPCEGPGRAAGCARRSPAGSAACGRRAGGDGSQLRLLASAEPGRMRHAARLRSPALPCCVAHARFARSPSRCCRMQARELLS